MGCNLALKVLMPSLCLHHLLVQHMILQFVRTLSTLHCHYPFHFAVQSDAFILFLILFHISFISSTSSDWAFYTFAVTSSMNCFIYFLFSLPMSHSFIIIFLSLLTSRHFQSNFGPHSKINFCASHTSHTTNIRAVSSLNQNVIYLVTYCVVRWSPGDLVNVFMLIPCFRHI